MPEVVVNNCYGGFSLSEEAKAAYNAKAEALEVGSSAPFRTDDELCRDDPLLVEVIKELGERANGRHAKLCILTIPDDVDWTIGEYDGKEWVEEVARKWFPK